MTTGPDPTVPARRETSEQRAQRNPLVRMVVALGNRLDVRRARSMVKSADKIARRDAFASNPEGRAALLRTYQSGVSPESLAAASSESRGNLVAAIEAAQSGQTGAGPQAQGGPDAQLRDGEHAQNVGMNPPVSEGQGHAPGSASGEGKGVTQIDRGSDKGISGR